MTDAEPRSKRTDRPSTLSEKDDLDGIGPISTIAWSPLLSGVEEPAKLVATEEILDRRRAVRDLGRALRAAGEDSVMSEVTTIELSRATRLVTEAGAILRQRSRSDGMTSSVDEPYCGIRMYSPMSGEGSPLVRPLTFEFIGAVATATCVLGAAFEGPPHHVHGGVSSMLMDQALGHAVASSGRAGLTRKLVVDYRAPVPSGVELRICGKVLAAGETDVFAQGWITTVSEPSNRLIIAEGHFRILRPDQAMALIQRKE